MGDRARRKLTLDSRTTFRHAESEIERATQALAEGKDHTPQMEALRDTCSAYIEK